MLVAETIMQNHMAQNEPEPYIGQLNICLGHPYDDSIKITTFNMPHAKSIKKYRRVCDDIKKFDNYDGIC